MQAVITLVNHLDSNKGHSKGVANINYYYLLSLITSEFSHCFCPDSLDWGYSPFLKWKVSFAHWSANKVHVYYVLRVGCDGY